MFKKVINRIYRVFNFGVVTNLAKFKSGEG